LPVWPGDTPFSARAILSHGPDSPVEVGRMTLSTHSGTHADAPVHYDVRGQAIADVPLVPYIGRARVIDLAGHRGPVRPSDIKRHLLEDGVERVLLRTFERFPHDQWASEFSPVAADTIRLLSENGVVLVGTDAPSLDPEDSKSMEAHMAVRDAGMRILEGLVLDDVPAGDYELIALPLKLEGLDASPVRAVLRELRT
jgi:arylformamidase